MAETVYRGVVKGRTIVLRDGPTPPAEGTEVLVTPLAPEKGTPAAVLAALATAPGVPAGWVDELEQLIAEGHSPPVEENPFADDPDHPRAR